MSKSSEGGCPFCDFHLAESRLIHRYDEWNLFVQPEEKRRNTKRAAGFLALKSHVELPVDAPDIAWLELKRIIPDASKRLCVETGVTYMGHETVGFNQGEYAGQTVKHAHIHILPVAEEDPVELRKRGGIGGAFEELRESRVRSDKIKP